MLVVGDLNIDLILSGIPRMPEFGEEVLAEGLVQRLGGSAANFAVFCARMGLRVALVANVGRDEFGDFLRGKLQEWGVTTDYVRRDPELATGITVSLSGARDRAFVTYVGTIDSLEGGDVPRELLGRSRHMHVASYFLQTRLQPGLPELVAAAHEVETPVSLDTGFDPDEDWDSGLLALLPEVDIFMPNEIEAQAIAEAPTVDAAMAALCALSDTVTLKTGPDGALASSGEEIVHVPAFPMDVVDTTCCGDAFNAGFIEALLNGHHLRDAVARGNACGGLMAAQVGNDARALSASAVTRIVEDED